MTIHHPPENLIVVELPSKEFEIADEIKKVNEITGENAASDIIIDFARVEAITSSSLSNLLILHNMQADRGRRLVLCNVSFITKCVFNVAGLEEIFEFARDRTAAVATVQTTR